RRASSPAAISGRTGTAGTGATRGIRRTRSEDRREKVRRSSDRHDLLFLALQQIVDLAGKLVRELLDLILTPAPFVLAEFVLLHQRLDVVAHGAPRVPDGDPRLLGHL